MAVFVVYAQVDIWQQIPNSWCYESKFATFSLEQYVNGQ